MTNRQALIELSDNMLDLLLSIALPDTGRLARRGGVVAALQRRSLVARDAAGEWKSTGYGRMVLARHLHARGCERLYARVLEVDPEAAVLP